MLIKEKINMDVPELFKNGAITIVAFGDSVTHGCAAGGEMIYDEVYHNRLKKMILAKRDFVPVNVINSGIGSTTASWSLERLERDVVAHNPDIVIVCFGLNDCGYPLEKYVDALDKIFARCKEIGAQTIFLTPNMLNTKPLTEGHEGLIEFSKETARRQNEGVFDLYINEGKKVAEKHGVQIADAYAKWKEMAANGIDTDKLLANGINHPTPEMHQLFADEIIKIIFSDNDKISEKKEDGLDKK